jgi:hypothetical protein
VLLIYLNELKSQGRQVPPNKRRELKKYIMCDTFIFATRGFEFEEVAIRIPEPTGIREHHFSIQYVDSLWGIYCCF